MFITNTVDKEFAKAFENASTELEENETAETKFYDVVNTLRLNTIALPDIPESEMPDLSKKYQVATVPAWSSNLIQNEIVDIVMTDGYYAFVLSPLIGFLSMMNLEVAFIRMEDLKVVEDSVNSEPETVE